MRTVVICDCVNIYAGMRLVGAEAYVASTQEEFALTFTSLHCCNIGVLIITKKFENFMPTQFIENQPQILITYI